MTESFNPLNNTFIEHNSHVSAVGKTRRVALEILPSSSTVPLWTIRCEYVLLPLYLTVVKSAGNRTVNVAKMSLVFFLIFPAADKKYLTRSSLNTQWSISPFAIVASASHSLNVLRLKYYRHKMKFNYLSFPVSTSFKFLLRNRSMISAVIQFKSPNETSTDNV